jgi:hypothetical protein
MLDSNKSTYSSSEAGFCPSIHTRIGKMLLSDQPWEQLPHRFGQSRSCVNMDKDDERRLQASVR